MVAPVLETLVSATGVRELSLRGLVFAEATWLRPNRPEGFLHYHGTGYYEGGGTDVAVLGEGASVTSPVDSVTIPACVTFDGTTGVEIEGCRFTRLGASGLGVSGLAVRGRELDTLSAAAFQVSAGGDISIEDNRIHHIGIEFGGSPAVAVTGTRGCLVAHNEITHVPRCGIVVGPGEGARVLRNLVAHSMEALADGGGLYVSGPQGDSPDNGALISGNVIKDTRTPYNFGLYTDYGAAWVTVEGNVVMRADHTAVLTVENVTYKEEEELNAATVTIQERAGLRG
ncbi:right-handed parallel beta-helix repeat-containing protein [Nonomuraea sp. NPDC049646]|uniref:right-handed parallel beta-helix repeat-containing protein n=1 Tax=unclassified Nonomuraea TaxID=2593643 RepID=UPI0037B144A8